MNKALLLRAGCLAGAVLLLAACEAGTDKPLAADPLPPCTASGSIFQGSDAQAMAATYHGYVGYVVEQHLDATMLSTTKLQCDAADERLLMPPSDALKELAAMLPPWQDPVSLEKLSSLDTTAVLLEFLRIYECSLLERQYYLPVVVKSDNRGDYVSDTANEAAAINEELRISRSALDRTLLVLGGVDRLRPLVAETECVKRATLDLRNTLGLTAEAMSCAPRAFDARGSLLQSPPSE